VLDQVDVAFDDERAVANAGLLLPATLAERLGIEQATDQLVDLAGRPGAAHPGRKLLTLVHAMVAGADCIDDVELLRCGSTASALGHRVMAASTQVDAEPRRTAELVGVDGISGYRRPPLAPGTAGTDRSGRLGRRGGGRRGWRVGRPAAGCGRRDG
jgi:hypothetical protein